MGSKMVSVRVPVGLLAEIDRQRGVLSRSGFLVRAAEGACGLGGEEAGGVVASVTPLVEKRPEATLAKAALAKAAREAAAIAGESKLRRCPVNGCGFRASSPSPRLMCPTHWRPMLPLGA